MDRVRPHCTLKSLIRLRQLERLLKFELKFKRFSAEDFEKRISFRRRMFEGMLSLINDLGTRVVPSEGRIRLS